MNFLLSGVALAQTAAGAPKGPSFFEMLVLPVGFLLIMYFFIIRPQQKKAKDHQSLIDGIKSGDEVVTTGGIIGRVRSVADTFITIEIASNTAVKVLKTHIGGRMKAEAKPAEKA